MRRSHHSTPCSTHVDTQHLTRRSTVPDPRALQVTLVHALCLWLSAADMIHEKDPITNTFVSVPADMGQLNCAAYIAGIIAGVLDGASFVSSTSTHCPALGPTVPPTRCPVRWEGGGETC